MALAFIMIRYEKSPTPIPCSSVSAGINHGTRWWARGIPIWNTIRMLVGGWLCLQVGWERDGWESRLLRVGKQQSIHPRGYFVNLSTVCPLFYILPWQPQNYIQVWPNIDLFWHDSLTCPISWKNGKFVYICTLDLISKKIMKSNMAINLHLSLSILSNWRQDKPATRC